MQCEGIFLADIPFTLAHLFRKDECKGQLCRTLLLLLWKERPVSPIFSSSFSFPSRQENDGEKDWINQVHCLSICFFSHYFWISLVCSTVGVSDEVLE